jgi:hypothetical protein
MHFTRQQHDFAVYLAEDQHDEDELQRIMGWKTRSALRNCVYIMAEILGIPPQGSFRFTMTALKHNLQARGYASQITTMGDPHQVQWPILPRKVDA